MPLKKGKILISDGTNNVYSTPTYPNTSGTAGKVLISDGTNVVYSTPTFPNASATAGKIIISDGTNWIASTPTYPNTSGAAGKILISDGTNNVYSTPTYPNASATSGKIITSDGTNFIASAYTVASPGSSGNVLTSDGTNWTSAAPPGGGLASVTINLSNAQIKALSTTAVTILAAQGAGIVIVPVSFDLKLIYGGTNAFTGSGSTVLGYGTAAGTSNIGTLCNNSTFWTNTQNEYILNNSGSPGGSTGIAATTVENAAIAVSSTSAISGNAANNNTGKITMVYYTVTL